MNTEEFVVTAVKGLNNGECEQFDILVKELMKETLDAPLFYLNALRRAIKHINKRHETLIGVILNIDWTCYNTDTQHVFIEFLTELVSAKTFYAKVCIRSLIKQFVPRVEIFDDDLLDALSKKCAHIHNALRGIIAIAPLSSTYFAEAVKSYFPYTGKSLFILETYIVHILQLTVYVQEVRFEMMQLLIDKLITVDVLVPRHKIAQENMYMDQLQYERDQENIHKLDQLMAIVFAYMDSASFENGTLDYDYAKLLFKDLLKIHETFVIKTQSSHVQFVLFYMASLHKDFTESFIETCWRILQDPNYAGILRQASACYLSSFLARAKFVSKDVIKRELKKMSEWIHRYIDFQDDNANQGNEMKHTPFYSACQALFYVFVYHHKMLLDSSSDIKFIKSMNLVRIVTSRLNPLKVCLDSIVKMFARLTRMYQIVFCYSIIERNNRSLEQMRVRNISESEEYMGKFFPFDPYVLPKSGKWIEPLYCPWNVTIDT